MYTRHIPVTLVMLLASAAVHADVTVQEQLNLEVAVIKAHGTSTKRVTSDKERTATEFSCDGLMSMLCGKNSSLEAFDVVKQIGLEGIMVNMGSAQDNLQLRKKELQEKYLQASARTKVKISSLAIGELNDVPYKSDPRTEEWVYDTIDVAKNLNVSVILLAFFYKGDLRNDEAGKKEVINRLKRVAPKAEKQGITLGIESYLSAPELMEIIQRVGSKSIKVYYDFRNPADAGYHVIREIKLLGKESICELHIKENGFLLGEGTLDWNGYQIHYTR